MLGRMVEVEITDAHANSLAGQLISGVQGPDLQPTAAMAPSEKPIGMEQIV
jgi:hypothetical protein